MLRELLLSLFLLAFNFLINDILGILGYLVEIMNVNKYPFELNEKNLLVISGQTNSTSKQK